MSTVEPPRSAVVPPLEAGQRLDQATFHERYEAMPDGTWAELVGGVVYMPSPLRIDHGEFDGYVSDWLGYYLRSTKGGRRALNATTKLGDFGETQPDCHLRIPPEAGGLSRLDERGYLVGAPELVIEVARSSRSFDLGPKKNDYQRAGVPEYVVVELGPDRIRWFVLRGGQYVEMPPGPDGIYRSEVFPGLWLDPAALFAEDLDGLIAALDQGLATPEHAAFAARLAQAGGGRRS